MTDTENTEAPEQGEPQQIDVVLALAETMAVVLDSILQLNPPRVQQGDLQSMRLVNQLQQGMAQLHAILSAMGSGMVQPAAEEAGTPVPATSSIIIPGR